MTTNQAFIKAYRQDGAQGVPSRANTADATRSAVDAMTTSVAYVSAGTNQFAQSQFATTIDTRTPFPIREGQFDSSAPRLPQANPATRVDPQSGTKRPLSSFTTERRAARQVTPEESTPKTLRPSTTIASFRWPAICRTLCRQSVQEFDRVAELLIRHADDSRKVIGIMGLFPRRGCTTTLLCLAARLAVRGSRTIMVEGNFGGPQLAEWLDAQPTAWWQDVLERSAPVADAIIHAEDDQLDLMPLRTNTRNSLALASCLQVFATAAALRYAYDLVLIDLGSFFDPASQPIALELVRNMRIDAVLGVTGPEPADTRDLATISEYLQQSGCELLGTIQNRIVK